MGTSAITAVGAPIAKANKENRVAVEAETEIQRRDIPLPMELELQRISPLLKVAEKLRLHRGRPFLRAPILKMEKVASPRSCLKIKSGSGQIKAKEGPKVVSITALSNEKRTNFFVKTTSFYFLSPVFSVHYIGYIDFFCNL